MTRVVTQRDHAPGQQPATATAIELRRAESAALRHAVAALRNRIGRRTLKAIRALPDTLYLRAIFLLEMRRFLHLRNPRTYGEKIQWLKVHGSLERYTSYADKYEVRQYVSDKVGSQYLVPLIGLWDDFDQIPLDALPERFVLKATHGCGYNFVCRDRSSLDVVGLRETTARWMSENFYVVEREPQYRSIRPRLIAEAYLEDEPGQLRDYKFLFFDGVFHMLEVIGDRDSGVTCNIYDRDWNLSGSTVKNVRNSAKELPRPALLDEMFDVAAKLAAGFPFVRVDLYYVGQKIYFGELTFTPHSGLKSYVPKSFEDELGRMLDLPAVIAPRPAIAGTSGRAE
jgi:hypothetical protein